MPKRPEGSIRQRADGQFQIRYSLGTDPLTGKRKRIEVTHEGTYESAKVELRRLLRTIDLNEHIEPSKITVTEFLSKWLEIIHSRISPKTYERYADIVNNFLVPELGASRLIKLDGFSIQQVYLKWETTGRRDKKGGLAPRTRLHIHRVLKLALSYAVKMKIIPRNPGEDVTPPKPRKAPIKTLTVEQSVTL